MKFKPVSTGFRFAKSGKMYCVIYERGNPGKVLFTSPEGSRSEIVQTMQGYLNANPEMINRVVL